MTNRNETNTRIVRDYLAYLKEAQRNSEQTIDSVAASIARFEDFNKHRDFRKFHQQQAVAFKRHLANETSRRGKATLSKSTVRSTLAALRAFFHWLAGRPGYRSRFSFSDADYFNPSDRESRIALAPPPAPGAHAGTGDAHPRLHAARDGVRTPRPCVDGFPSPDRLPRSRRRVAEAAARRSEGRRGVPGRAGR